MSPRLRSLARLSNAQARSLVKRINERIAAIGRSFGKDSDTYRDTIANITQNEQFSKYVGESKSGYVKINMNLQKGDWNDPNLLNMVKTAQGSVKTITQLESSAKRRLKEQAAEGWEYAEDTPFGKYEPTKSEIREEIEKTKKYENDMKDLVSFIYDKYTDTEAREKYPELYDRTGSRLSYDVIDEMLAKEAKNREKWLKKVNRL